MGLPRRLKIGPADGMISHLETVILNHGTLDASKGVSWPKLEILNSQYDEFQYLGAIIELGM